MIIFGKTNKGASQSDMYSVAQAADDKGMKTQLFSSLSNDRFHSVHTFHGCDDLISKVSGDADSYLMMCTDMDELDNPSDKPMFSENYCAVTTSRPDNEQALALRFDVEPSAFGSIIPMLLERFDENSTLSTIKALMTYLDGNFSFVFMKKGDNAIYAVNNGKTLYVGCGDDAGIVASDIWTISPHASKIYAVEYGETAVVTQDKISIYDKRMKKIKRTPRQFRLNGNNTGLQYPDTLKKEIFSCPQSVESTCKKLLDGNKLNMPSLKLHISSVKRIYLVGSGDSYAIALAAKENLEAVSDIPSFAAASGEFCCSNPVMDKSVLLIAISQDGENEDTLNAVGIAKKSGAKTLAITNTPYSTLSRMCKSTLLTSSGYESAKINAKFFPAAYTLLALFALDIGKKSTGVTDLFMNVSVKVAGALPDKIRLALKCEREINVMAKRLIGARKVIIIGQNVDYATALQGAITMTATAKIDCIALPSSEIKTILPSTDCGTAVIGIAGCSSLLQKTTDALSLAKRKGARTFLILPDTAVENAYGADCILPYCDSIPLLNPAVEETIIQLLSYGMAVFSQNGENAV